MKALDFKEPIVAISLLGLSLGACWRTNESNSYGLDSDHPIKVNISQSYGKQRVLLASSDNGAMQASYCQLSNGSCDKERPLRIVGVKGDRKIFGAADFPTTPTGIYRISLIDGTGEHVGRDLFFGGDTSGQWKGVFAAGDYMDEQMIPAWDNARRDLASLMIERGFRQDAIKHLSRNPDNIGRNQVAETSAEGIASAFQALNLGKDDSCFLFMTSHGSRQEFYIEGAPGISPQRFANLLDTYCGERPTVAIVSACYAGIMLTEASKKPNRIIFTAADAQHTSNGCQPGITYTFFDECLIQTLKKSDITTYDLAASDIKACIDAKETPQNASFPQFYIGDAMKNTLIAGGSANSSARGSTGGSDDRPSKRDEPPKDRNSNKMDAQTNLALKHSSGQTSMKEVAGDARYLFVDFSQPLCGACHQFAAVLERKSSLFEGGKCKALTLVGPGQLSSWISYAQAYAPNAKEHSYELAVDLGEALNALQKESDFQGVATPTVLLFDTTTNSVVSKQIGGYTEDQLENLLGSKCR